MATTKIGILGSGQVAYALAKGFLKYGYSVMLGSRDVAKLEEWKKKSAVDIQCGSFEQAATHGDIVVLAVRGTAAESLVRSLSKSLSGKVVFDTTNPIAESAPENGVLKFFTDLNSSLMEKLQDAVPEARFVKIFSSVGNNLMINPAMAGGKPTMFICGNDDNAKATARNVLDQFGWETADMGKVQAARAIEPLCMLWCIPGFLRNEWGHAFKLIR